MRFQVNNDKLKAHTKMLQSLHKSALPVAIRGTLNDAVFNVKTVTMPTKANEFKKRQPNFFKANSKFEKAEGFNVGAMKATIGFFENKLSNAATNYAVKDLEQQEKGGTIKHKTFIPESGARNNNKLVKSNFRIKALKGKEFIQVSNRGKTRTGKSTTIATKKQQYIRAAIVAKKLHPDNPFLLGNRNSNGSRTLSKVNSINRGKISRTPLYSVKKGRAVPVKATNFMKRASMETAIKLPKFYMAQAERQFQKLKK